MLIEQFQKLITSLRDLLRGEFLSCPIQAFRLLTYVPTAS